MTGLEILQLIIGLLVFVIVVGFSYSVTLEEYYESIPRRVWAITFRVLRIYLGMAVVIGVLWVIAYVGIYLRYLAIWFMQSVLFLPLFS